MSEPRLRVRGLRRTYQRRGRLGAGGEEVLALAGLDLDLDARTTLALVGVSGAGKSTLARCLALLEPADAGEIRFAGSQLVAGARPRRRSPIQLLFQDAGRSLNPRLNVEELVAEPLAIAGCPREERSPRVAGLLDRVGLSCGFAQRRALELSGGERQRVAIARALAAEPKLLIVDEALSGLDPSLQAQIAVLLAELRESNGLQCLHISHDLALMAHLADELAILHEGRLVERGPVRALLEAPSHPQTEALVACLQPVRAEA